MIEAEYKFKSQITLGLLPFGVTMLKEVDRSNVSNLMQEIVNQAGRDAISWIQLSVQGGIITNNSWRSSTVAQRIDDVRSDLIALKGKLSHG